MDFPHLSAGALADEGEASSTLEYEQLTAEVAFLARYGGWPARQPLSRSGHVEFTIKDPKTTCFGVSGYACEAPRLFNGSEALFGQGCLPSLVVAAEGGGVHMWEVNKECCTVVFD